MQRELPMQLPYGAVYFRKSNPPREDWERDYQKAAADGMNIFRHWFLWGSIEVSPGVYDWEDYDRQMELAAKYGIKTIIAEITTAIPEWLHYAYPQALSLDAGGNVIPSQMGVSSATGGFHSALCMNHPDGRMLVKGFLTALAERYKGHPGLLGYDVWNECNYRHDICYNEATKQAFRRWLEKKYGTLKALGEAWYRYSYTAWEQVQPPPKLELYPESFDWLQFRKENAYSNMQFAIDCIRAVDTDCLMSAHGTGQSLDNMALGGSDDWMAAERVELYGFTFVQSRKGAEPYKQFAYADLTRAGARGKAFWHAEAQGGPLWLQPQLTGRPLSDGRVTHAEDIRLWNMVSLAAGARGILYPRWRPLLDGPLFGAFGPYAMDGSETPRSRMAANIARWANDPAQKELLDSAPVRGDIGIVVVPESQIASKLLSAFGNKDHYFDIMQGAYKAFFDNQIQADWVHIDDIGSYNSLYLPYPVMLTDAQCDALCKWVEAGGRLVSEGCPGYFGERGKVRTEQPGGALSKLFGAKEEDVQFIPDILEGFRPELDGLGVLGAEYVQTYVPTEGQWVGSGGNSCISVCNDFGKGSALLVGTCPSLAYFETGDAATKRFFRELCGFYGVQPALEMTNPAWIARLSGRDNETYLWLLNPTGSEQSGEIRFAGPISEPKEYWPGGEWTRRGDNVLAASLEAKNVLVLRIS